MSVAAQSELQLAAADTPAAPAAPLALPLVFTGSGSEYFRIWVVNTLLTLLTLGVYSAWAKVRRTRYLWQNTRLDGFAFDYHARPLAILRGRLIALLLFGAYTYAFDFSKAAGVAVVLLLCALGPWLFMRAQQFKLANTSWRGLRFGFDASTREAFHVVLPILVIWFSATLVPLWYADDWEVLMWSQLGTLLPIPWMHHRLKAYQHGRACYGDRLFGFQDALLGFYWIYLKGVIFMALGFAISSIAIGAVIGGVGSALDFPDLDEMSEWVMMILVGILGVVVVFVFAWPYLAARLQQVVWSRTRVGGVRFHTQIRVRTLLALAIRNVLLTLLTLGLYWPFAAMRLAKYRIECMHVVSETPFGEIAAGTHTRTVGAGGEGAADAFGLDLGL